MGCRIVGFGLAIFKEPNHSIFELDTCSIYDSFNCLDLLQYRSLFGVEAGVAFLCTCLIAKTMEVKNTRDLLVVFNFALFVSASLLLHSQAFWMALIVFSVFIMCMVGLYRIQTALFQQKSASNQFRRDLKQIFKFVAVATPFLFYYLFSSRGYPHCGQFQFNKIARRQGLVIVCHQ